MMAPTKTEVLARMDALLADIAVTASGPFADGDPGQEAAFIEGGRCHADYWRREHDRVESERQAWLGVAKSTLSLTTQQALARARTVDHRPCPARCRQCSRCIHSLAYWQRRGDYLGANGTAVGDAA